MTPLPSLPLPRSAARFRLAAAAFLALAALLLAAGPAAAADPVRVLMLDYNAPDEHDFLLSQLCVDRCTRANGCPDDYVRRGVDYFSDDFVVFRPQYLGQNATFVIRAFKDEAIDLLSISGHHASGFSGEYGRGQFQTEMLSHDLAEMPEAAPFFTKPSMVMLHGCRTDVKSSFQGDPVEYVLHVIDDTTVRGTQFERLLAAVQQIGGVQEQYRDLFPNACLLGYRGTQTPGGAIEIYGQVDSTLRRIAQRDQPLRPRIDLSRAYASRSSANELVRRIGAECPGGWPCNLCRRDSAYYRPLASSLASMLRRERQRIHVNRQARSAGDASRLETLLESGSFYANSRWACSSYAPGRTPVWPDPVDESPFGLLFAKLLLTVIERFEPEQQKVLEAELVHRLGNIEFAEADAAEVRAWLKAPENWQRLQDFIGGPLVRYSTFRQRDFFTFFAGIGCDACFSSVLANREVPSLLRENAAARLRPSLGREVYALAMSDPDPRVRQVATASLDLGLGRDLVDAALRDDHPAVRAAAVARFPAGVR